MSNKLVEHKESKEILTGNQKKILFWICFIILSIAFITVWINILLTSKAFNTNGRDGTGRRLLYGGYCDYR
mgnify:CR=1 FL=1